MGDERISDLGDLLIINVDKDMVNKIDLNIAVDDYEKLKNRRYPLFYLFFNTYIYLLS